MNDLHPTVALDRCCSYDGELIRDTLRRQLDALGVDLTAWRGKNVVIKPNLVMRLPPDRGATTHPAVVAAMASLLCEAGCRVTVAECPGGPMSSASVAAVYHGTGIADAVAGLPVTLNTDIEGAEYATPDGRVSKTCEILKVIADCDVLVNLCKLKTHTFMQMSAAVKNLFGTIPGTRKVECHARFREQENFTAFVNDLCAAICRGKETLHVCDGVVGMQGNGPTAGTPMPYGVLLSSRDPFALDAVCERLLRMSGETPMLRDSRAAGLAPEYKDVTVVGEDPDAVPIADFTLPDTRRGKKFSLLPGFLAPRPVVDPAVCIGCGECARSCPQKTITVAEHDGKRTAKIDRSRCIRCFCCQELCPRRAVVIRSNFLYRLLG